MTDGHHRIYILRERGVNVDTLPRVIVLDELGNGSGEWSWECRRCRKRVKRERGEKVKGSRKEYMVRMATCDCGGEMKSVFH